LPKARWVSSGQLENRRHNDTRYGSNGELLVARLEGDERASPAVVLAEPPIVCAESSSPPRGGEHARIETRRILPTHPSRTRGFDVFAEKPIASLRQVTLSVGLPPLSVRLNQPYLDSLDQPG
jgi:hypothetical protein